MRLRYFSSGPRERVLAALLDAGHEIEAVYATSPARWPKVAPTLELARRHAIPVRLLSRRDLRALGPEIAGSLCLSAGFAYILPPEVFQAARLFLNVHGTLLPHYRGGRTLNWVIARGETRSGVTVHAIDAGIDTGPVLLQRAFDLSPFDTGASLYRKTLEFEPQVVLDALARLAEEGEAALRPQAAGPVERLPDRTPEHSRIDPTRPLVDLIDAIRASDPERFPAFFEWHGQTLCIRLWRPDKPEGEADML